MRRSTKVKVTAARIPVRKSTVRGAFPAWIDAGDHGVSFLAAKAVMPRVRDALVLRVICKGKRPSSDPKTSDVTSAR
jgi:hypothetical protein